MDRVRWMKMVGWGGSGIGVTYRRSLRPWTIMPARQGLHAGL